MTMPDLDQIKTMVQHIAAKNMIDASGAFNDLMSGKVADALEVRRQEIAASLFNGGQVPAAAETSVSPTPDVATAEIGEVTA
jgi:hypothetical protein